MKFCEDFRIKLSLIPRSVLNSKVKDRLSGLSVPNGVALNNFWSGGHKRHRGVKIGPV